MADLRCEYIDAKNRKHSVEHMAAPAADDKANRERIIEEVLHALTRPGKRIPA